MRRTGTFGKDGEKKGERPWPTGKLRKECRQGRT